MFGNGLDMHGHIDATFNSPIEGGIRLIRPTAGDYSGPVVFGSRGNRRSPNCRR